MNLKELEAQYQEDMQQAKLEGEQALNDADNKAFDDYANTLGESSKLIAETKKQLGEVEYRISYEHYGVALTKLNYIKEMLTELEALLKDKENE